MGGTQGSRQVVPRPSFFQGFLQSIAKAEPEEAGPAVRRVVAAHGPGGTEVVAVLVGIAGADHESVGDELLHLALHRPDQATAFTGRLDRQVAIAGRQDRAGSTGSRRLLERDALDPAVLELERLVLR